MQKTQYQIAASSSLHLTFATDWTFRQHRRSDGNNRDIE